MEGYVIVQKDVGDWPRYMHSWIFVPSRQVKFNAMRNGNNEMIVCAFLTNTPLEIDFDFLNGCKLRESHDFSELIKIPDELVIFAYESVEERHRSVDAIADIFKRALERRDANGGFTEFIQEEVDSGAQLGEEEVGMQTIEIIEANLPHAKHQ